MHAAVVIPFRSRGDHSLLAWTLDGYQRQQVAPGHSFEVFVGFDGSESQVDLPGDGPVPVHGHTFSWMGAPAVRNALVRETSNATDLLIFGNADARPFPDMVQCHLETMATLPPRSMVLGSAPREAFAVSTVFDALVDETPMVFAYSRMQPRAWYDFTHGWTVNISVRRQDFLDAGGFYDKIRPLFYEDLSLAQRVVGRRPGIWYEPSARVLHRHRMTLEEYLDREELLGLMAPTLQRVDPETFAHLFGPNDNASAVIRAWLQLDRAIYREMFGALKEWAALPQEALGGDRPRMLRTLFAMHLPLKRLAFRVGFLEGPKFADDSLWKSRRPLGLWRAFLT